jgi:Protein of unknown function (DUF1569)
MLTKRDRVHSLASMRRLPRFHSYDEVLADAENLVTGGYERIGTWNLGQVCDHLAKTMGKSLDGFPDRKPWPFRFLARSFVLGGILKHRQHLRRFPAPSYLEPASIDDDRAGLGELLTAVNRLKGHSGELQAHPVFGRLTHPQWLELHLWHCEHHLSFLIPKTTAARA